ncbi:hypothetical protein GGF47_004658, partial [Coemansia sp. RSA 2524]
RIRQDLEKISVADDISEFIRTFGTGAPDPGLTRASTQGSGGRTSKAETSDDEGPVHGSAVPVPASHNVQGNSQSNAMNSVGPNNAMNSVGSSSNAMNTMGSNNQSMNTLNSSSSYNAPSGNMQSANGTARSGSIATARPQTQESMHQRPVSMHAQASVQPMMNGHSPGWNGRPTSAMHGAAPDASYRRASNNDMYGMANGMANGMQMQQQQQFVQRTNSQMAMRGPETPPGYVYVNNMDPRAPSSMSAYRANGGTNSPVPMANQPNNMNAYRSGGNAQMANQQRPGTPSQMDAYGVPRMESPRSRAGTFNAPAHTGTFGTLTGTAQMQPFAGHGSGSAPGSPYQQQPASRPSSAMGGAPISGSPHMGNARPVSVMQQPQYVMQQPYRAATPVQQQQYVPISRPPTQMSHSPVPQMHPQMGAPSPHMHQRAPSVMGGAYSMPPSQQQQQQPHMMQQRSMSRVEQSGNSVSESGKEILFY